MIDSSNIYVRAMKVCEIVQLADLIKKLQTHQQMRYVPRIPTQEDLINELTHLDEQTNVRVPNNYGTYTCVAIDQTKTHESGQEFIVGYLIYSQMYSVIYGRQFYINSLFILEDYRRGGVGKKLMAYVQEHARASGNKSISVPFMNNNHIGQKFYSNYGSYLVNDEYMLIAMFINQPPRLLDP